MNYLADATEMKLLHMVTADPARTPTLTAFAKPDYFVFGGAPACTAAAPCVTEPPSFAWNHGDVASEINVTWLGLVGPGVAHLSADANIWTDHADVRPTMLALAGLRDDYVHQGRVVTEAIEPCARPRELERHHGLIDELGRVYKQLNAPVGQLALASLRISTKALAGGNASGDEAFVELRAFLTQLTTDRDRLAGEIEAVLDEASFGGQAEDARHVERLLRQARELIEATTAVAAFVDALP
jgi:hypothetical protein